MKKINHILIIFFSTSLLVTTSCKKDFMDRFPQTEVPPELFFSNEQDLATYVNGLTEIPSRVNAYRGDQGTDDKATTSAVEIKSMMTGSPSSQNITGGWNWGRLRNINYFLDNYQKADADQHVKDHYAGVARYYRAVFYMNMVKRYSDVPWYAHTMNPQDTMELYKGRDPRALVMDSVMADLEFAATHTRPERGPEALKVPSGTPGKWSIKHFQARTALYEGTFRKYHSELGLEATAGAFLEKAAIAAKEIMDSGLYGLDGDYRNLFISADLVPNPEVLLADIYDAGIGRISYHDQLIDYELSPSRDLVQTYLMKDGSRFTDQPGYETFQFVQEFEDRDPRIYHSFWYPGLAMAPNTTSYVQRLNKNFTGYHQYKGYINTTSENTIYNVDYPAYRFAETLLIYAEAKAELGTLTQQDLNESVNGLRDRVDMPHLDMAAANAAPDPRLEAKYPNVTGANKGVILEIRREKRVEFAMEGYRMDDLMRWDAGKVLEEIPEGMYFPGLGKYDLTGDGIEDLILIDKNAVIPEEANKETNSLGVKLDYYKAGSFGEDVTVYLRNGNAGGTIVTETTPRQFISPKYYYRPIPNSETVLNPQLKQIFNWD